MSKYRILALRIILSVFVSISANVSLAIEQASLADEIDRGFNSYTKRTPLKDKLKGEKSMDFVELQDYLIMKLMSDRGTVVGYLIGESNRGNKYTAVFLKIWPLLAVQHLIDASYVVKPFKWSY